MHTQGAQQGSQVSVRPYCSNEHFSAASNLVRLEDCKAVVHRVVTPL